MNCKHIMGALAFLLSLCFIVSAIAINSDDDSYSQDFVLGIPGGTIHLDANGGTCDQSTYQFSGGDIILENYLPTPVKEGYTFAGWYWDGNCTDRFIEYASGGEDGDMTLYAKWITSLTADNYNLSDEFGISTADEFIIFSSMTEDYSGKTVYLTADITLTDVTVPNTTIFNGTFDGQNHLITSNTRPFGTIGDLGTIKNLGVTSPAPRTESSSGGIAYSNSGSIVNCYNAGALSGTWNAGIVHTNTGTIIDCYNTGALSGHNSGGIAYSNSGSIVNCYNAGSLSGYWSGGIAYSNTGTIINCYNIGDIIEQNSGGIVYYNDTGSIINCYNAGALRGTWNAGIAKMNKGTIVNCYNVGTIYGSASDELVHTNYETGVIINSYFVSNTSYESDKGIAKTAAEMQTVDFAATLGDVFCKPQSFTINGSPYLYPVFTYQANIASGKNTISFDANGGNGSAPNVTLYPTEAFLLPSSEFTRDNHRLDNWNTSPDGTGVKYKPGSTITAYDGMTLYAQWVRQYVVIWDLGNETIEVLADVGSTLTLPENIVNSETQRFDWWYFDENFESRYHIDHTINSDTTLYAKWITGDFAHPAPTTDSYESSDTFEIWTAWDYLLFIKSMTSGGPISKYSGKTVYLACDIDITGTLQSRNDNSEFAGTFDGQHHSISGSTVAMFYYNMGTIKNLTIKDCVITQEMGGDQSVAGFVCRNSGVIENCCFAGEINTRGERVAGIAANNSGTIKNCCNVGNITASGDHQNAAGIAASNSGTIENCYNTGNITAIESRNTESGSVAGIAVSIGSDGSITNCYNAGIIKHTYRDASANRYSTYAIAETNNGSITNCYYLENTAKANGGGTVKTATEMQTAAFIESLGAAYQQAPSGFVLNGVAYTYPVLTWQVFSEFTVDFNSNGGSSVESQTVRDGYTASRPTDPTKSGYIFGGWYTNVELTAEYTFTTAVTEDIILYAKWYENLVFTSVPSISDIKITIDGRTISASVAADNYLYILWDLGNGEIIRTYSNELTYTYAEDGDYTITATAVNSEGYADTEFKVSINDHKNSINWISIILAAVIGIAEFAMLYKINPVIAVIAGLVAAVIVYLLVNYFF